MFSSCFASGMFSCDFGGNNYLPSVWSQVLDRQRGRGVQAVESPLLWADAELEDLLQGMKICMDCGCSWVSCVCIHVCLLPLKLSTRN